MAILKELGFDPGDDEFENKLAELFLDADGLANVRAQIVALDADDFRDRNEASKQLAMVGAPIGHLIGRAREGAGIDMSRRIQAILNARVKQRKLDALYHGARLLAVRETPGFVDRLLVIAGTFDPVVHWELLRVLEMAVARTSGDQDRARLDAALENPSGAVRESAAFAIGFRFNNDGQQATAAPAAVAADDLLRLAVARGLAAKASSGVAVELVALLESTSVRARHEAGVLLRGMTGQDFGFAGYDDANRRAAAVGRWKNWLAGAANAQEELEAAMLGSAAREKFSVLLGRSGGKDGSVVSWSTSGKKIGAHPLARAVSGTAPDRISVDHESGITLAWGGGDEDGRVSLLTLEGEELWSGNGVPVGGGAAYLGRGRILVAAGKELEEIDVTGQRVARKVLDAGVRSLNRVRAGRYVCAHTETGRVAEYDAAGEKLWQAGGFTRPGFVERLSNGNLLVAQGKPATEEGKDPAEIGPTVVETDPNGKVIATLSPKSVSAITSAARLPNGNTLIATEKGLAEYTPEGYAVKVWIKGKVGAVYVQ